jgi:hypothetical protein
LDSPKSQKQTSELPNRPHSTTVPKELKKIKGKKTSEKKIIAMNKFFFFLIGYPHILLKDKTSLI